MYQYVNSAIETYKNICIKHLLCIAETNQIAVRKVKKKKSNIGNHFVFGIKDLKHNKSRGEIRHI